ncbi:MAG: hypothetical protein H6607_04375 [Flavobacteriales bacterium]|nr:hypothetical protein [Flavobacteriales bacterium]
MPIVDSLQLPEEGCGYLSGCGSCKHYYKKWEKRENCPTARLERTKYLTDLQVIKEYSKTGVWVTFRFQSTFPGHEFYIEFTGKEI